MLVFFFVPVCMCVCGSKLNMTQTTFALIIFFQSAQCTFLSPYLIKYLLKQVMSTKFLPVFGAFQQLHQQLLLNYLWYKMWVYKTSSILNNHECTERVIRLKSFDFGPFLYFNARVSLFENRITLSSPFTIQLEQYNSMHGGRTWIKIEHIFLSSLC